MTRYARGGQANKKKPNEATTWANMKADMASVAKAKVAKAKDASGGAAASGGGKVITRLQNGQYVVRIGAYEKVLRSEAELRRWKRTGSERRRVQRKQRREVGRVCFLCRQPGHLVNDCPEGGGGGDGGGGGSGGGNGGAGSVCFRCGSSDHALSACPKMPRGGGGAGGGDAPPAELPFASCFVCGRSGHLSRSCPDNPRGLYPNGGGCLLCASVEHFKRDCPLLQKRRAEEALVALPTRAVSGGGGVDDEVPLLPSRGEADDGADAGGGGVGVGKKRAKKVKVVVL